MTVRNQVGSAAPSRSVEHATTSGPRFRGARWTAILAASVLLSFSGAASAAGPSFPSRPLKGRVVFEKKLCIRCHSIAGAGGVIGPDLAQAEFSGSFLDLGAIVWNHIPDMAVEYKAVNLTWPTFSDEEVTDLLSFLYYLRYLGTPGDTHRGRRIFQAKGCNRCHSVGREGGGKVGPPLDRMKRYASPIFVIQSIWNHGPGMLEQMQRMGVRQPRFTGQQISDLAAYIRSVSRDTAHDAVYLSPGDPNKGMRVFSEKGCPKCHSIHRRGGKVGPALDGVNLHRSVSDIASVMWNHGATMLSIMQEEHLAWPTFQGGEMADLIAYLYFIPFADPPGDARRGEKLFEARQCRSCHALAGQGGTAAHDLAESKALDSDASILRAMINQGARMWEAALSLGKTWQPLTGQDLRDIGAYLRSSRAPEKRK